MNTILLVISQFYFKKTIIHTKTTYQTTIAQIKNFIKKGFKNLSENETTQLEAISKSFASFEKLHYPVPKPEAISEMIELKMYEMHLSQKKYLNC